jgi:Domain of unknown function (DUF4170)
LKAGSFCFCVAAASAALPLLMLSGRQPTADEERSMANGTAKSQPQLLHLVFGGELKTLGGHEFRDPAKLDLVGMYPDYKSAFAAWKSAAQRTVDNAHMRYYVVHVHRLLEAEAVPTADADDLGLGVDDRTG